MRFQIKGHFKSSPEVRVWTNYFYIFNIFRDFLKVVQMFLTKPVPDIPPVPAENRSRDRRPLRHGGRVCYIQKMS